MLHDLNLVLVKGAITDGTASMLDSSMTRYVIHTFLNTSQRGLLNEVCPKAIGIHPADNGGVTLTTKKTKHHNRPSSNKNEATWGGNKSGPK